MSRAGALGAAAAGATSLAAGVLSAAADLPALGLVAGAAGAVAGGLGVRAARGAARPGTQPAPPAEEPVAVPVDELGAEAFDPESGLLRERFVAVAIEREVAAARRRLQPVSVVLFEVEGLDRALPRTDSPLAVVGEAVLSTLRECDTACRMGDAMVAAVLEDTPERGARDAAGRVTDAIHASRLGAAVTVRAGIACYPSHALDAPGLVERAGEALDRARHAGVDQVAIAET